MNQPPDPPNSSFNPSKNLLETIKGIAPSPGVYLMKDAGRRIIYVGKAINLQKRVTSYFQRQETHSAKTAVLVSQVADIETVVTASEKEALILESNLIKRHRPRYNVVLKDDKRYPSLRIDIKATYPKIEIVRPHPGQPHPSVYSSPDGPVPGSLLPEDRPESLPRDRQRGHPVFEGTHPRIDQAPAPSHAQGIR